MSMAEMDAMVRVEREVEESLPDLDNLPQDRDPNRDSFIDEKSAAMLEEQAKKDAEESGAFDHAAIWDSLTEDERLALLNSDDLGRKVVIFPRSPRYIDPKAVPPHLHLRWIAVGNRMGQWGYRPVLRKPETMEWVPNMARHGKSKVFMDRGAVLCAIPTKEWLARVRAEHHATNVEAFESYSKPYQAAIGKLTKAFGLTAAQAEKLSRDGNPGFKLSKGPDPAGKRDMVSADEIEEQQERASTTTRVRRGRRG